MHDFFQTEQHSFVYAPNTHPHRPIAPYTHISTCKLHGKSITCMGRQYTEMKHCILVCLFLCFSFLFPPNELREWAPQCLLGTKEVPNIMSILFVCLLFLLGYQISILVSTWSETFRWLHTKCGNVSYTYIWNCWKIIPIISEEGNAKNIWLKTNHRPKCSKLCSRFL